MLARDEMCFEGMGAAEKGVLRCWRCMKCVLWAWGQLKRQLEVFALCEIFFEGMETLEKGVGGVGIG